MQVFFRLSNTVLTVPITDVRAYLTASGEPVFKYCDLQIHQRDVELHQRHVEFLEGRVEIHHIISLYRLLQIDITGYLKQLLPPGTSSTSC